MKAINSYIKERNLSTGNNNVLSSNDVDYRPNPMTESQFLPNIKQQNPYLKPKSLPSLKIRILDTLNHKAGLSSGRISF